MYALEKLIGEIAELFGLPSLAIEAILLMILTTFIVIFVFIFEAIIRIKKEMIKFSLGANYIASLLTRGANEYKQKSGVFDFHSGEWQDDIEEKILMMLHEGKSIDEIRSQLQVSESFINEVRKWAYDEGTLFTKPKI